jgi:electron transport complex protein RnfD
MYSKSNKLNIADGPHWRDGGSLARIHKLWLLALMPAMVASVWLFGLHSLRIMGLAVALCVFFDAVVGKLVPSKDKTTNWSSVTLAILLSFMMPYNAPWWLIMVGCFIMIVIGKRLFGGLGAYPVHPAMLSYAILLVSWPHRFDYTASLISLDLGVKMVEPLRLVKTLGGNMEHAFFWQDLLMGKQVAGIGNALVLYLLVGGLFLLILRQISWQIPVAFILGNIVVAGILNYTCPGQFASPIFYLLSGGTIYGAFFLATEYTTSPVNSLPMFIFGFLGGALLMLIRAYSIHADGVVFAVLLINICNPLLDRITPRIRGIEATAHA